jgi:hypothetical protein
MPPIGQLQDGNKRWTQRLFPGGKPIFNFRRKAGVGNAVHNVIRFHVAKLLARRFLRDAFPRIAASNPASY